MADMKYINNLEEQLESPDDSDLLITQTATETKKITWGAIWKLIKAKLNIGDADISKIGDGTITGAVKTINDSQTIKEVTYAEYMAIPEETRNADGVMYIITDVDAFDASNIAYSGNVEGATNVKGAIDALATGTLRYAVVRGNFMFTSGSAETNYHDVTSLVTQYNPKAVIPVVLGAGHLNIATVGKNGNSWYLSYINKGSGSEIQAVDLIILY